MPTIASQDSSSPCLDVSKERRLPIRKVAVLGAGTMGARIAAHVANAGLEVLLLDIATSPADGTDRNQIAVTALDNLKKSKPAAFVDVAVASTITIGNFEDDLRKLRDCDWVIEAVVENLTIKRTLLASVGPHLRSDALLTTNTSGLRVSDIGAELPADLRSRWFGVHFFNPPRYMRLVEFVTTPETDPAAVASIAALCDAMLGKTVVAANDVPNFIANRIGTFAIMNNFRIMKVQGLSIEEVDWLTGSIVGWPRTGTFRLADMVGIDVLGHVARNFAAAGGDERSDLGIPAEMATLIERKWLGDKTKQGFYRKSKGAEGSELRESLDLATLEYRPAASASFPAQEMLKSDPLQARIELLLGGDTQDRGAQFYWVALPEMWTYAANRVGEVSESIVEIDAAMKAGFNWELGPFEMWDAAGIVRTVAEMRQRGLKIPAAVEKLLASGSTSWYREGGEEYFDPPSGTYKRIAQRPDHNTVTMFKRSNGVFAENKSISLIDMGDNIGCFEFHSKMNSLDVDVVAFLHEHLAPNSETMRNFDGFVIANDGLAFSAGANLVRMLTAAQEGNWSEIDRLIREFQGMTQAIKFSPRPVVSAPFGLCLGGGTEISMQSAQRQAHIELQQGLVETRVGLVPGGGGCKESVIHATVLANEVSVDGRGEGVELHKLIKYWFDTIVMAKVSDSAVNARTIGFIRETDGITMNRSRLAVDAKARAIQLVRAGYTAPIERTDIPAPGPSVFATLKLSIYLQRQADYITEHEAKIATTVANILSGGDVLAGTLLSEQYLLDLEREAFLSLCGERKTQERIAFTLKNGKLLRN